VLVILAFTDWRVSLAMAVYAIITIVCFVLVRRVAVPHWKQTREVSAELFGFLEEQLAGTEDVRSSGATAYTLRELDRYNRRRLAAERRAGLANALLITQWYSRVVEAGARAALAADPASRFAGLLRTGLEEVLS
jgi:ABC-type multidrug transport system fused ATPase/permease subunit